MEHDIKVICYQCNNKISFWGDNYHTYCSNCDAIVDNTEEYVISDT